MWRIEKIWDLLLFGRSRSWKWILLNFGFETAQLHRTILSGFKLVITGAIPSNICWSPWRVKEVLGTYLIDVFSVDSLETRFSLHEKCPYSELFWTVFSWILTEYGEILCTSPYSVQMWENTGQSQNSHT